MDLDRKENVTRSELEGYAGRRSRPRVAVRGSTRDCEELDQSGSSETGREKRRGRRGGGGGTRRDEGRGGERRAGGGAAAWHEMRRQRA
eukprot:324171-Hanusia_phi.AAC.2